MNTAKINLNYYNTSANVSRSTVATASQKIGNTPSTKQQTCNKLSMLLKLPNTEIKSLTLNVIKNMVEFKAVRNSTWPWNNGKKTQDMVLNQLSTSILELNTKINSSRNNTSLAPIEDMKAGADLATSITNNTINDVTVDEIFILIKNSSHVFQDDIPKTFKIFLMNEIKDLSIETAIGSAEFLKSNKVMTPIKLLLNQRHSVQQEIKNSVINQEESKINSRLKDNSGIKQEEIKINLLPDLKTLEDKNLKEQLENMQNFTQAYINEVEEITKELPTYLNFNDESQQILNIFKLINNVALSRKIDMANPAEKSSFLTENSLCKLQSALVEYLEKNSKDNKSDFITQIHNAFKLLLANFDEANNGLIQHYTSELSNTDKKLHEDLCALLQRKIDIDKRLPDLDDKIITPKIITSKLELLATSIHGLLDGNPNIIDNIRTDIMDKLDQFKINNEKNFLTTSEKLRNILKIANITIYNYFNEENTVWRVENLRNTTNAQLTKIQEQIDNKSNVKDINDSLKTDITDNQKIYLGLNTFLAHIFTNLEQTQENEQLRLNVQNYMEDLGKNKNDQFEYAQYTHRKEMVAVIVALFKPLITMTQLEWMDAPTLYSALLYYLYDKTIISNTNTPESRLTHLFNLYKEWRIWAQNPKKDDIDSSDLGNKLRAFCSKGLVKNEYPPNFVKFHSTLNDTHLGIKV